MKEKCVTFCFIELNGKVSSKSSKKGPFFCKEVQSVYSKLIFTHIVSCWSHSHEIVKKWNIKLSPETERASYLTNSQAI